MTPTEHTLGRLPAQARIGNGNAVAQLGGGFREWLVALMEIALKHHSDQRLGPARPLPDDAAPDFLLAGMLFAGICVTAIDHQDWRQGPLDEPGFSLADALGSIFSAHSTAPETNVPGRIAPRVNNSGETHLG